MVKKLSKAKMHFEKKQKQEYQRKQNGAHRSFRRSYREDYKRELKIPGLVEHTGLTFKVLFDNWRVFLGLLLVAVGLNLVLLGLAVGNDYGQWLTIVDNGQVNSVFDVGKLLLSSGSLLGASGDASAISGLVIFLVVWLVAIYLVRHGLAKQAVSLRDGLYNAMSPAVAVFLVLMVALLQCVPVFFLIIIYAAALQTGFLAAPFYALLFWVFAVLMIVLTAYWLSSTLVALVAVTAPGLYPMTALRAAADLVRGRRLKLIARMGGLVIIVVLMWGAMVGFAIMLNTWLQNANIVWGTLLVPVVAIAASYGGEIYAAVFLYLLYRWILDGDGGLEAGDMLK